MAAKICNYTKALVALREAVNLSSVRELSKLEKQGLIQGFEYTHERAWKTLKDFLKGRGVSEMYGSKDATREAFALGLIEHGEIWMNMINSRNLTSHIYDESVTNDIVALILNFYFIECTNLYTKLMHIIRN